MEFDTFVAVDWSAASAPTRGRDSIWIAWMSVDGWQPSSPPSENPPTRARATRELHGFLVDAVAAGRRVVVATDFPHGYPSGTAAALGLGELAWQQMWRLLDDLLDDGDDNRNDRSDVAAQLNARIAPGVAGPFWGHQSSAVPRPAALPRTKKGVVDYPVAGIGEWRLVEQRLRARGWRPMSVWQLAFRPVGGQALTGIPRLRSLRHAPGLAEVSVVWPFETGFADDIREDGPLVVHAEMWPRLVEDSYEPDTVLDRAQVRAVVGWLRRHHDAGRLHDLFTAPDDLAPGDLDAVVTEEGWILGAT